MKKIKYLIIGAGVTGLRLASHFSPDDYKIIEKDSRIGGLCKSFYKNGFVWDYAGHFFHFRTEKICKFFESRIEKDELVICKKNTKIYYNQDLIDYPFQKNIHQLSKDEFIECLLDVYYKKVSKNYRNFEEMLYGKFGEGITEKFLKPYNQKLYACELTDLDVDAMGRFFPYAEFDEIMNNIKNRSNNSYNDTFQYPKHGAQVFVDAIRVDVPNNNIITRHEVKSISLKEKKAITDNGEEIFYEFLINTTPLKTFCEIIDELDDYPKMSGNKVLVFNLGFDKKTNIKDVHWIYFPQRDINFYRVGFYDNILSTKRGSLYVEIGFPEECPINIEKELEITIINLKKCGIIDDSIKMTEYNSLIINLGYVHIAQNNIICQFKEKLNEYGIYSIGRYGGWTYCSIEDCMLEADELADKLEGIK